MQLPFTREQFFDLAIYCRLQRTVWRAPFALWIASAAVSALLLSPPIRSLGQCGVGR